MSVRWEDLNGNGKRRSARDESKRSRSRSRSSSHSRTKHRSTRSRSRSRSHSRTRRAASRDAARYFRVARVAGGAMAAVGCRRAPGPRERSRRPRRRLCSLRSPLDSTEFKSLQVNVVLSQWSFSFVHLFYSQTYYLFPIHFYQLCYVSLLRRRFISCLCCYLVLLLGIFKI